MTFKKWMKSHNLYLKGVGHKGGRGLFRITKQGVVEDASWYGEEDKDYLLGSHQDIMYDQRVGRRNKNFVPTL